MENRLNGHLDGHASVSGLPQKWIRQFTARIVGPEEFETPIRI